MLTIPILIALTMRPASDKDDFLYVVAWTLKEHALGGRIDVRAIGHSDQSVSRSSRNVTYMQSDCYRNLAPMIVFVSILSSCSARCWVFPFQFPAVLIMRFRAYAP